MSQTRNILIGLVAGFLFFLVPAIIGTIAYKVALAFDHSENVSLALGIIGALSAFVICFYLYLACCRQNIST